jgi:hypothetical protein
MPIFATNIFKDPRATALTRFSTTGAALTALSTVTDFPGAINTAARSTRIGSGAARLIYFRVPTPDYVISTQYRVRFEARASEDMAVVIQSRINVTSATSAVTFFTGTIPAGVSIVDVTGTTSSAAGGANAGFTITRAAGTVGSTLDVTAILIQRLPEPDIGYFDGSVPSNPSVVYRWDAAVNDSVSIAETGTGILDSRKKMWFGSENHMQAVPLPSTGMQVSRSGYYSQLDYNNGRKGIRRSNQTSKSYDMDFPVQEAHLLDGVDVFAKFASGFYGDCNRFPLFFADPMNYDSNLMPEAWATPGLYASGWNSIVGDHPNTYQNFAMNPSGEVSTLYWTIPPGPTGTVSRITTTTAPRGARAIRGTKTGGTGMAILYGRDAANALSSPASPGTTHQTSLSFRSSIATTIQITAQFYNGSNSLIGSTAGSVINASANAWTTASVVALSPAGTVWMTVLVNGTTAGAWSNGNTLDVDGLLIENQVFARPAGYFDGDTPGAFWNGARGLSTSQMYVETAPGIVSANPSTGTADLPPIQVTWPIMTAPNAFPTPDNLYGNLPYALIPVPPGYSLWFSVDGSATGSAAVRVDTYETAVAGGSFVGAQYATLNNTFWSSPTVITPFSGQPTYVKIYVTKTTAVPSTITLSSMTAQLWPVGVTPPTPARFHEGRGHRGLIFGDGAVAESYVMIDRGRNVPIHYKGLSTTLEEAEENN